MSSYKRLAKVKRRKTALMKAGLQSNRIIIFSTNFCVASRAGKIRHANQGLLSKTLNLEMEFTCVAVALESENKR